MIVGATFAGADVAELLHSATLAIVGQVPLDRLWHAVPSFPTISEVWLRLLETYRDERLAMSGSGTAQSQRSQNIRVRAGTAPVGADSISR